MDKRLIAYSSLFIIIIGLIIYIDASAPKPVNWNPTYGVRDKNPFGLYVLERESKKLFKGQEVEKFSETPYEFFDAQYDYENDIYKVQGAYFSIEENSALDEESVNELVNFARHGNTIFISTKNFPETLLDTLGVKIQNSFFYTDSIQLQVDKPAGVKHYFTEGISFTAFDSIDPQTTRVLGSQYIADEVYPNFIQVQLGTGKFILHTQPAVFTNFHLLKNSHYKYAQDVLSILPADTLYWQISGTAQGKSYSAMRYIISQPGLKWAYYLSLIALFVFMFFNAKRKQRFIPEIEPVRNTTVDFAKTIGNLYLQEGNHHTIAEKKIIYFLEKIRREYLLDTYSLDAEFIEKLQAKTGKSKEDIEKVVQLIKKHRHDFATTEADVIKIIKAIDKLGL